MDDVDARKCRDGRLEYLGIISFLFIAVPMTCILFNPMIGGMMVDAAIPAFYTSAMVAGVYLYSISLTVLLVTVFFLIFVMNYWAFVYLPASRAHYKRREKLKRIKCEFHASATGKGRRSSTRHSSKRSTATSFLKYMSRVMNIVKRAVQHGITLLSVRRKTRTKSRNFKALWRDMNRPPIQNGMIAVASPRSSRGGCDSASQSPRNFPTKLKLRRSVILFPSKIIKMSTAANAEILGKGTPFKTNSLDSYSDSVIYRSRSSDEDSQKRKIHPMLTFDAKQALTILRSSLSPKENGDRGSGRGNADEKQSQKVREKLNFDVSESNLSHEFRSILEVFYPDGVALTDLEKEEACELFDKWKESQNARFSVRLNCTGTVHVRYIKFNLFEEWFQKEVLDVVRNTLSDRLLSHSLKAPSRRHPSLAPSFSLSKRPPSWKSFRSDNLQSSI